MKKKKTRTIYRVKRDAADMTQEYAAEQLDISLRTIQNFEYGKREPKISLAFKMADLYGCDVNEFRAAVRAKEEDNENNYSHV